MNNVYHCVFPSVTLDDPPLSTCRPRNSALALAELRRRRREDPASLTPFELTVLQRLDVAAGRVPS